MRLPCGLVSERGYIWSISLLLFALFLGSQPSLSLVAVTVLSRSASASNSFLSIFCLFCVFFCFIVTICRFPSFRNLSARLENLSGELDRF